MHGSEAEVRIRVKAEALLREALPKARIIHEYDLGGVRMDIAAVTDETMILVEIKSERDTLDRLANQVRWATSIGCEVWVVYADRWRDDIKLRCQDQDMKAEPIRRNGYSTPPPNPLYIPKLSSCVLLREEPDGPLVTDRYCRDPRDRTYVKDGFDSRRLLGLLHKPEVLALAKPLGGKSKMTSYDLITLCHEHMTGREIRRGALAHIAAHAFFWADQPTPIPKDMT